MKRKIILWIALPLLALSCNQKPALDTRIVIAGKLENVEEKEIEVFLEDDMTSGSFNEDGSFHIVLNTEETANYFLRSGEVSINLFLSPGDSVYLTGDVKEFNTSFKITGSNEAENNYLFEKSVFFDSSELSDIRTFMGSEKTVFFETKNKYFAELKEKFNGIKQKSQLHPEFLKIEEAFFEFEPLIYEYLYPNYHASIHNLNKEDIDFPVDETKAKLASIDVNRSDILSANSYVFLLNRIVDEKIEKLTEQDSTLKEYPSGYEKASYLVFDELFKNQEVKDYFIFNFINSNLNYRGPMHIKESYDKFLSDNKSPKLVAKLEKNFKKWEPIMPGKEVPDFTFENIDGQQVKLSDLKGNLVYIDIWATWCGPCIAEHPHWDKLKAEFTDKPIAFLTISIDNSKEPWEKMLKSKNMEGLQWFAQNAWKSEITQHFMVNSIPRFILLDKEGKVLDPSADRPSGDIKSLLNKHL